jgi:hypothetical protein
MWKRTGSRRGAFLLALLYKRVLTQKCERPKPLLSRLETLQNVHLVAHTGLY